MITSAKPPRPGETLHWLVTGKGFYAIAKGQHVAFISRRGQELTITPEMLDANRDRHGELAPWLNLLHDPEAQVERFGERIVAPGAWPLHLLTTVPGEPEHEEARRSAVRQAEQIEDPTERRRALADIERLYGPAQPTSRTLGTYAGDPS